MNVTVSMPAIIRVSPQPTIRAASVQAVTSVRLFAVLIPAVNVWAAT